jgi:hypothetical protein
MDTMQIIQWARKAGFKMENSAAIQAAEALAKLVAAHEREAIAAMVKPLDESLADEILARGNNA